MSNALSDSSHPTHWSLDHISVTADKQCESLQQLIKLFGLRPGYRPPFPFAGRWFYQQDRAVLHVIDDATAADSEAKPQLQSQLLSQLLPEPQSEALPKTKPDAATEAGPGLMRLHHIAFRSEVAAKTVLALLQACGLAYQTVNLPAEPIVQVFIQLTPELLLELDLPADPAITTDYHYSQTTTPPTPEDFA